MRSEIEANYITKYSDVMVAYIDMRDLYNESSGDVESPTGWFGRAGKWIIIHDERGFVSGDKFTTEARAISEFERLESERLESERLESERLESEYNLWGMPDRICVDCAIWHANGDTSGMDEETEARVTGADIGHVIVGDPQGFSWHACDACGTRLGGDRFSAQIGAE